MFTLHVAMCTIRLQTQLDLSVSRQFFHFLFATIPSSPPFDSAESPLLLLLAFSVLGFCDDWLINQRISHNSFYLMSEGIYACRALIVTTHHANHYKYNSGACIQNFGQPNSSEYVPTICTKIGLCLITIEDGLELSSSDVKHYNSASLGQYQFEMSFRYTTSTYHGPCTFFIIGSLSTASNISGWFIS